MYDKKDSITKICVLIWYLRHVDGGCSWTKSYIWQFSAGGIYYRVPNQLWSYSSVACANGIIEIRFMTNNIPNEKYFHDEWQFNGGPLFLAKTEWIKRRDCMTFSCWTVGGTRFTALWTTKKSIVAKNYWKYNQWLIDCWKFL